MVWQLAADVPAISLHVSSFSLSFEVNKTNNTSCHVRETTHPQTYRKLYHFSECIFRCQQYLLSDYLSDNVLTTIHIVAP